MTRSDVVQIDKRFVAVIVTVVLAALALGGNSAWSAGRINTEIVALRDSLRETTARLEAADAQNRLDDTGQETRIRALEQGAGRTEAKLEAIAAGIERLNGQIDRLLEEQRP